MNKITDFGETHDVSVTVLVDNRADLLVKFIMSVKYFTDQPLAEHGFAALIHLKDAGIRILWDAGVTRIALLENMKRMKLDPAVIDKIVLSHGHSDHIAALTDILRAMNVAPKPKDWRVDWVWAILGGFHLAPATGEEISLTIAEIKAHAPELVAPTHCSGFQATSQFAASMPAAFAQGVVGATYLF